MNASVFIAKLNRNKKVSDIHICDGIISDSIIGFTFTHKRCNTYYWFNVYGNTVIFDHAYNRNTGKVSSTVRPNWDALVRCGYFEIN